MANARISARDRAIFEMYERHHKQHEIAKHFGIPQTTVSDAIKRHRAAMPAETKEEMRQQIAGLLDMCTRELAALAMAEPIPAYSNGRPVVVDTDENGKDVIAKDHTGRVKAMAELRAMIESKRKMYGIDEPVKATVDTTVKFEVVGVDTGELT